MSQVSESLFRLGDQFRRGFRDQGQNALDVAELRLKEAGLKRQAMLDEEGRPARQFGKTVAERGLKQAADWEAPAKGSMLMNSLGTLELMSSADQNGTPRLHKAVQYMFGEGTTYDPDKDAIVKKDGSVVSNAEMSKMSPRLQEWMTMNASPYRMARSARDEMGLTLSALPPDHPDAPKLKQQVELYGSLMKNPEWKLQALEKRKAYVSQLPDDPFGEKKENLAQIDKEIGIVRAEAVAMTKRGQELSDIETKHGQAKELKGMEIEATDKRAKETRATTLEAARIRAGATDNKFNKGEAEYQDALATQKILGPLGLQIDEFGKISGQVSGEQLKSAQAMGKQLGYEIQAVPGKPVDRPGWFTGNEPMFQITGINRVAMPGRAGGALGQPAQPEAQPTTRQPAQSKTKPVPLTGPAAVKRSQELVKMIDDGKVDERQLLNSLRESGQRDVVINIVAALKAKAKAGEKMAEKTAEPKPKTADQIENEKFVKQLKESPAAKSITGMKRYWKENILERPRKNYYGD